MELLLTGVLLLGITLLAYGCWLAWAPAGFIVAGVFLILIPLLYVRGGRWVSSSG